MAETATLVRTLAAPLAESIGLDLLDVQVRGSGPSQIVKVVVDRKGGVAIEDIQEVAKQLSAELDAVDPVEGRYSLEVTSPGTDFPLSGQRDFDRVEGRGVLVHHDVGEGRILQVRGTVQTAEAEAVLLDVEGSDVRVPYHEMVKATQTLPW